MKNVKIVIGANFGDEGKGLTTDYFSHKAISDGSCIVVCCNGGAQKGHTVTTPDGLRHVTHHFGSGILAGADTYLSEDFIINPILFRMEREELIGKGITPAKVYVNGNCMITTPYDMLINQIQEGVRGGGKHGSCGVGIYETIQRHSKKYLPGYYTHIGKVELPHLKERMDILRIEYVLRRLEDLGIREILGGHFDIMNSSILVDNFYNDVQYFLDNTVITYDEAELLSHYDTAVFECSQGLLLDQNNHYYYPHLTPSNTGVANPIKVIRNSGADVDIEICYVTRTYVTRHGAGILATECEASDIASNIVDLTNVPNQFQDAIRYGKLDVNLLLSTISKDVSDNIPQNIDYKVSLMITHVNETSGYVVETEGRTAINEFVSLIGDLFDKVYLSDGMTRDNVK
jgi:adenylosuccinate synthase